MKVTYNKNGSGGVIRWDYEDWLAGLAFNNADTTAQPFPIALTNGLAWMERINPFNRVGFMRSGPLAVSLTNASAVTATLTGITNGTATGSTAYAVGGNLFHEINLTTNTVTNAGAFPRSVTNSTMSNTVAYFIGTTRYVFYSYTLSGGGTGNVGRYDLVSTFNDTWLSTGSHAGASALSTDQVPHKLSVSPRKDRMYIPDGRNLHSFDGQVGANGTLTLNRLQLPLGFVITSITYTDNYCVIFAYRSGTAGTAYAGEATAYYWDEVSEDPTFVVPLNANYVDGAFTYKNTPGCFVQTGTALFNSFTKNNHLVLINGNVPESKFSYSFNYGIPIQEGVQVSGNNILWNSTGTVWQYGDGNTGFKPVTIRLAQGRGSTSGILKSLFLNSLYSSSGTSTSGGAEVFSSTFSAGNFTTLMADIDVPDGKIARLSHVRNEWGQFKTSGLSTLIQSLSVLDGTTTTTTIKAAATLPRRSIDRYIPGSNGYVAPRFQSIQLFASYNDETEYIKALEVHFNFEDYS